MLAREFAGVWKENLESVRDAWIRTGGSPSAPGGDDVSQARVRDSVGIHKRLHRRVVAGAVAAVAVLALTYSAASALVNGATGSSSARSDYATVMQAASAEYRRARADCLALPFERRDACIAEAHSSEARMRGVASTAAHKQLSQLRRKSDKMLLAAQGLDSIVIEPACNIVARGSASVCEIQVKGSTLEAPEAIATATKAVQRSDERPSLAQWLSGTGRDRTFANLAALVTQ